MIVAIAVMLAAPPRGRGNGRYDIDAPVLHHEADGTLFDKIQGARDLAQHYDEMAPSPTGGGGLLDMFGSALGGAGGSADPWRFTAQGQRPEGGVSV